MSQEGCLAFNQRQPCIFHLVSIKWNIQLNHHVMLIQRKKNADPCNKDMVWYTFKGKQNMEPRI